MPVIISTHSPFMFAMRGARIYDIDENQPDIKKWTELENVRIYHDFFEAHKNDFQMCKNSSQFGERVN
ncbi:hypothetical protein FACS1894127_0890 [Clostridia bacterium]|nr:hypothetical protein FACS1894127_0890 [Clostridia bacterium]